MSADGKGDKLTPQEIAQQSQAAYAALASYSDTGKIVFVMNEANKSETNFNNTFNIRLQRPNLYRIEWMNVTEIFSKIGVVWGDGSGNYMVMGLTNNIDSAKPEAMKGLENALASAKGVSYGAAGFIPSAFYKLSGGLTLFTSPRGKMERLPDEKVGNINCQVILLDTDPVNLPNDQGAIGKTIFQLWIGKADHFIHQVKLTSGDIHIKPFTDKTLKEILERQGKAITPEAITALRAQMEATMKIPAQMNVVIVETHENIKVNPPFTSADFAR